MSTWTATDVANIKSIFNLDYKYVDRIENALTDFETQYGAIAITNLQSKINSAIGIKVTMDSILQSANFGITQQSVPNFYSVTRKAGSELSGYKNAYDSLKQSISSELQLADIARINSSKIIRA